MTTIAFVYYLKCCLGQDLTVNINVVNDEQAPTIDKGAKTLIKHIQAWTTAVFFEKTYF